MDAINLKTGKYIHVPIDTGLYNEYVRRSQDPGADVASQLEILLATFLDEHDLNNMAWHLGEFANSLRDARDEMVKRCGPLNNGYQWQSLFLPNGTRLMTKYRGEQHFAEVRHSKIVDEKDEGAYSPSEWASKIANNTARNAWRDIWVQDPMGGKFRLADTLRQSQG